MQDAVERAEWLLEGVPLAERFYPGSLLYFVSGVLEDQRDKPIVGMQRFYTGTFRELYPEVDQVAHFLDESAAHAVWSKVSGGEGLSSGSLTHGGFETTRTPWRASRASSARVSGGDPHER